MPKRKLYHVYNLNTEVFQYSYLSAGEVALQLGLNSENIWTYCNRSMVHNETYIIIDAEINIHDFEKNESYSSAKYKVPPLLVEMAVREFKANFLEKIKNSYKKLVEGTRKNQKYYLLNSSGHVVKIYDTMKEMSEGEKVPLGTVKSRLDRATRINLRDLPVFCRMGDYDTVRNLHY